MDFNSDCNFSGLIDQNKRTKVSYAKGETIFKQGAFAPYVLYVIEGLVKVYIQTGLNKQINISIAQPGDFLAFAAVFGEPVHTYSTQAITPAEICMIEKASLQKILLENPEFALNLTSKNYRNEKHLLEIIKNTSYKQMRGKVASTLIYLSQEEFRQHQIFQHLTRQDLADFASVSTESAIKILKEFEKEKIIRLEGKEITVVDVEKLQTVSQKG